MHFYVWGGGVVGDTFSNRLIVYGEFKDFIKLLTLIILLQNILENLNPKDVVKFNKFSFAVKIIVNNYFSQRHVLTKHI